MFWFKKKKNRDCIPEIKGKDDIRYVSHHATNSEKGSRELHIIGAKYPMKGDPTPWGLMVLTPIKTLIDKILANKLATLITHEIPDEKLTPAVREIARGIDLLIEAESLDGMKSRWRNYKRILIFFLENDLAYRYRFQWLLERLDLKKIALDDGDKYYFRAKNFRVDLEDEWRDCLNKYPQLKEETLNKEFRKYAWPGDCPEEVKRAKTPLVELAEEFINNKKT